jgi:Family of unknown function (DUF5947)
MMASPADNLRRKSFASLQALVRKPKEQSEKCELCAAQLDPDHQHLLELDKRQVVCSCGPCSILFGGSSRQRFKRIPRDVERLVDFKLEDHEWESLLIPIKLAYFVFSTTAGKVIANYPSPGGAMESSLDLEYWSAIVDRNPVLKKFEPDVEALLVNRIATPHYYRVPIDQCFRLVGLIRKHWRGLSGGEQVWREIDRFFNRLSPQEHKAEHA